MINVSGLQVDYPGTTALRGVDLTVPPGNVLGVIGPRYAGKSTLLRAVAGLVTPSDGSIAVGGLNLHLHAVRARTLVGYMPARPALYPELRVWECLDVLAAAHPIARQARRERIHQVLDAVGLHEKWNEWVRQLYARERALLAFSWAIFGQPEVLLLDEPGTDLKAADAVRLGRLIRDEAERGVAVLLASETLTRWDDVCDGVLVLEKGRVVNRGETRELRREAGITGQLVVRLTEPGPANEALLARMLRNSPHVHDVHEDGQGAWLATFLGSEKQATALLQALVAAGLPVSHYQFKDDDAGATAPRLDYTGSDYERLIAQ